MNKGDDKLVDVFQSKCFRGKNLLERAQMKSLSEKVKARR